MAMQDAARARRPARTARGAGGVGEVGANGARATATLARPEALDGTAGEHGAVETVPVLVFKEFLRRLHDGPMQELATLRVALTVWQQALDRGDTEGAAAISPMVQDALQHLITGMSGLQETGRRWTGGLPLDFEERRRAAAAAQEWAARTGHS